MMRACGVTKLVTASTIAAGAASAARPSGVGALDGVLGGGAFAGGAAAGVPAGAWPARGAAPPPVGP